MLELSSVEPSTGKPAPRWHRQPANCRGTTNQRLSLSLRLNTKAWLCNLELSVFFVGFFFFGEGGAALIYLLWKIGISRLCQSSRSKISNWILIWQHCWNGALCKVSVITSWPVCLCFNSVLALVSRHWRSRHDRQTLFITINYPVSILWAWMTSPFEFPSFSILDSGIELAGEKLYWHRLFLF